MKKKMSELGIIGCLTILTLTGCNSHNKNIEAAKLRIQTLSAESKKEEAQGEAVNEEIQLILKRGPNSPTHDPRLEEAKLDPPLASRQDFAQLIAAFKKYTGAPRAAQKLYDELTIYSLPINEWDTPSLTAIYNAYTGKAMMVLETFRALASTVDQLKLGQAEKNQVIELFSNWVKGENRVSSCHLIEFLIEVHVTDLLLKHHVIETSDALFTAFLQLRHQVNRTRAEIIEKNANIRFVTHFEKWSTSELRKAVQAFKFEVHRTTELRELFYPLVLRMVKKA